MLTWIKTHKLTTVLVLVVVYFLVKPVLIQPFSSMNLQGAAPKMAQFDRVASEAMPVSGGGMMPNIYPQEVPPQSQIKDRLVIQNSELSLLVKNVVETRNKIVDFARQSGGYMVNSYISNPQDQPTATLVVRVPSAKIEEALTFFRSLAVKIVSENLSGYDVTDEYVDVEKRIAILEKTMSRFEEILSQAREISDITNLNQQIINMQSQIDSLKGQQEALKQNASLARLTIYMSTDEIALPYAPSETFRPSVIFKLAVRSLVGHLRQFATMAIWLGVYAVIWVPLLFITRFVYLKYLKKNA